jgi:hypothetical protein
VIFNWRLFLRFGEGRGIKTPIAIIAAWIFIDQFNFDAVAQLMQAFDSTPGKFGNSTGGKFITSLIVAGGSAGIFSLFEKLGIRNPLRNRETAEQMRSRASLKITVKRVKAKQDAIVSVHLGDKIIGSIDKGKNQIGWGFASLLVPAGTLDLKLTSKEADGTPVEVEDPLEVAQGATVIREYDL